MSAASEVKIMATGNFENYVTVEFGNTTTAAQIRELILTRVSLCLPESSPTYGF
jgi:hypothetical protein